MCDVALAIAGGQRHCDAPDAEGAIAASRRRNDIVQDARCIRIGREKLAVDRTQHRALG